MNAVSNALTHASIQVAHVKSNHRLCREHYRLSFRVNQFAEVCAGQFVHLSPSPSFGSSYYVHEEYPCRPRADWQAVVESPLLRRAFSVAGVQRDNGGCLVDVIYRVVGTATRWLESLHEGDALSVLGPLGNGFPISSDKPLAWMVAGGVGLPPMLLLAKSLRDAGKQCVAFCGVRNADLLPLTLDDQGQEQAGNVVSPALCCREFAAHDTPTIVSSDDGSVGFHGYVGAALAEHYANSRPPTDSLVVYTCGPERMMHHVASLCEQWYVECYACMERSMACGTGLCQSCVVGEKPLADGEDWVYRLCCTDGPVFDASRIRW